MLGDTIHNIRTEAKLTQAQFSELFGVSQQTVQKWESGGATPELSKIIAISKHFDVSLDMLVLGNDQRVVEEMNKRKILKPQYQNLHRWEIYSSYLLTEYQQSFDEGLDIEAFKDVFSSVNFGERTLKVISFLSATSFGVYLIHVIFLDSFGITCRTFNPLISIPVLTVAAYAASLAVVSLIRKIPVINKYIM